MHAEQPTATLIRPIICVRQNLYRIALVAIRYPFLRIRPGAESMVPIR